MRQKSQTNTEDTQCLAGDLSPLLTEGQVAELLGLKPQTLAAWRSTGRVEIPYVKIGKAVRYKPQDVVAYLQDNTCLSTGVSNTEGGTS